MTTIVVIDSDEEGQTLVEQTEESGAVTRSWAPEEIPVEVRLNPDAPPAMDMRADSPTNGEEIRWAMPSPETWVRMTGGTEEARQAFRDAMAAAGHDVSREV